MPKFQPRPLPRPSPELAPLVTALEQALRDIARVLEGGNVNMEAVLQGTIISDPTAPSTGTGKLYYRDNGSGKVQLVVRFPTGAVQVLATEP